MDWGGCRGGEDTASMLTSICSRLVSLPSTVVNRSFFQGDFEILGVLVLGVVGDSWSQCWGDLRGSTCGSTRCLVCSSVALLHCISSPLELTSAL